MYVMPNFKTKKALKEAVAAGCKVRVFDPGISSAVNAYDNSACIEGPHAPQPHAWYAKVVLKDGVVINVK